MGKLTAIVLTYNEEENIEDCLKSISWIDNIIVLDSKSEDKTKDIALSFEQVEFYEREFDDFASQRNYALDKVKTDWVFVIDADERVTKLGFSHKSL